MEVGSSCLSCDLPAVVPRAPPAVHSCHLLSGNSSSSCTAAPPPGSQRPGRPVPITSKPPWPLTPGGGHFLLMHSHWAGANWDCCMLAVGHGLSRARLRVGWGNPMVHSNSSEQQEKLEPAPTASWGHCSLLALDMNPIGQHPTLVESSGLHEGSLGLPKRGGESAGRSVAAFCQVPQRGFMWTQLPPSADSPKNLIAQKRVWAGARWC